MRDVARGFGKAELFLGIAVLLGTLSCTGIVDSKSTGSGPGGAAGPGAVGAGPGGTGGPGTGGPGTGPTSTDPNAPPVNPGRGEMHRLNSGEYNNSVADVTGTTLAPANANWRGGEIEGFDNVASVLGVDQTQYSLYLDAAEQIANDVFASATLKPKFLTCATTDDAACVSDIVSKAGLHVFRRPLRTAEIATYSKVYTAARTAGLDHAGAAKTVLWSLLSSAEFLYRIELPKGAVKRPLDGYELASRLSYFLWSSAPDDTLLTSASNNALTKDADVQAQVDRMLTDGKSARFIESFAGQWLGARKVASHAVAPDRFPNWKPDVANAAMNEMYLYFQEFLQKDTPWSQFLKADFNYVNASLAPFYGMQNVTGANLTRVTNTTDQRYGFMGLVGFLTLSSMDRRTSPTLRGKWVLGNMLCQEAPPPPANVPKLDLQGKDLDKGNVREILEAHRVNPTCAGCHGMFDPFGLALENFDAVGQYRTTYGDMSAINVSTTLNGTTFAGLDGATDIVSKDPAFNSCFAKKLYIYGLGRSPVSDDAGWVKDVEKQWETGNQTIHRLISGLALSVPFRNSGDVK